MTLSSRLLPSATGRRINVRLKSAAEASTSNSKRRPRAAPLPFEHLVESKQGRYESQRGHRKNATNTKDRFRETEEVEDTTGKYFDEHQDDFDLNSRRLRLSRAARFGFLSSKAPVMLPELWDSTVMNSLNEVDKSRLKKEHILKQNRKSTNQSAQPLQSSILRLTTASPQRYAAVRSVLEQVRTRLGPDEEGFRSHILAGQWSPSRIVEYGCGVGEGLWSSASVFKDRQLNGADPFKYEGYDNNVSFLRAATEMVSVAKNNDETMPENEKDDSPNFAKMEISLRTSPTSTNIATTSRKNQDSSQPAMEPMEGNGTLVLCNHALSSLQSDSARIAFVKSLWSKHPTAEVLAFVENGDERGFACIASAREELLGLGKRTTVAGEQADLKIGNQTFYAESTETNQTDKKQNETVFDHQECHVVAPCPHDKPCPLLHDFELSEPLGQRMGKSSRASSPLFHGASHGMNICATSARVHNPEYARKTRDIRLDVENVQHCYLVIRKGARPTFNDRKRFQTDDIRQALVSREELQRRAEKTKVGNLNALRSGTSLSKTEIPIAEEITNDENRTALSLAELNEETQKQDEKAREELMRIFPQILQEQAGESTENVPEALQMAQNVLERSAQLGEQAEETIERREDTETDSLRSASEMLVQQLEWSKPQESNDSVEILEPQDIESMRIDAYSWPRLIIPPLKRSGHTIVDACTAQGSIDRFILAKSLGKQIYQDARKVRQGDLLPYAPIEEKPVLREELDFEGDEESLKGSDLQDDQSPVAMIEVQKVKTVMRRIPAALESQRNTMKPSTKIKSSSKRSGEGKAFIDWPICSAMAIGPDLIANGGRKDTNESVLFSSSTRRKHYKEGAEKMIEQFEQPQSFAKRSSRKASLASFAEEVQDAWAEDDFQSGAN